MKDYPLSKDYARLFELVQKQDVICVSNERPLRVMKRNEKFLIIEGAGYFWSETEYLNEFIDACQHYNLEFLDPSATEELKGALKKCVEEIEALRECVDEKYVNYNSHVPEASSLLKKYGVDK